MLNFSFVRFVCRVLIVAILGLLAAPSQAALMPAEETAVTGAASERAHVTEFLQRADVQKQLVAQGVEPQQAIERVAALSDDEVRQLSGKIDSMTAGGTDVIGIILLIFIVLLITDILGFTKVFPFTRSIR